MTKINKVYNFKTTLAIAGLLLLFPHALYSYPDAAGTLRIPIGLSNGRMNEVMIGPGYAFAGFEEVKESTENLKRYEGGILIEGIEFMLKIAIIKYDITENVEYAYRLFYQGEQIGVAIWKSQGQVPLFELLKVNEAYRSQEIGSVIPSLKGLSIARVLMNIVFKDISLDNKVIFSKTIGEVVMGDKYPYPEIVKLIEKFNMIPLDKSEIINMIEEGGLVRLGGTTEGYQPFFYLYLNDEAGDKRYVRIILKSMRFDRAIIDKKIYEEIQSSGKLIDIIEGDNDTYGAYIGGAWGIDQDKIDWLNMYIGSLPSWQTGLFSNLSDSFEDLKNNRESSNSGL